jgi:hypothetical protein
MTDGPLPRFEVALVVFVLLLTGCSKEPELVLRCEGTVGSFKSPLWTKDGELIAAHVKNGVITFSGNSFLLGENVRLCPAGTLGIPVDTLYFDSSGCSTTSKSETREYGTFNTILMQLDLTNTTDRIGVTGHFKCTKVTSSFSSSDFPEHCYATCACTRPMTPL